jgi:hypothetical protein
MPFWQNSDGQVVAFGVDEGVGGRGGEFPQAEAGLRVAEFNLTDMTLFTITGSNFPTASAGIYVLDFNFQLPKSYIDFAEVTVLTAFTSAGSPTLDFGTVTTAFVTTNIAGFFSAVAMTALDSKAKRTYRAEATDTTPTPVAGGALLGTQTSAVGYPAIRVNTANYTAGACRLRIGWRPV